MTRHFTPAGRHGSRRYAGNVHGWLELDQAAFLVAQDEGDKLADPPAAMVT